LRSPTINVVLSPALQGNDLQLMVIKAVESQNLRRQKPFIRRVVTEMIWTPPRLRLLAILRRQKREFRVKTPRLIRREEKLTRVLTSLQQLRRNHLGIDQRKKVRKEKSFSLI